MDAHRPYLVAVLTASLTLLTFALLGAACGSQEFDDEPEPTSTATTVPATTAATTATPDDAPESVDVAPLTAAEFCERAELTIIDSNIPERLTDQPASGTMILRYRLPPGAEAISIWIGVDIEIDATIGDLVRSHPELARAFPRADPGTPFPATIPSGGFELEQDGIERTVQISITFPTEQQFDGSEPWRWSSISTPPFRLGEPRLVANFRASGTRIRMDGHYCTPIILPLP
jgi:hypothetical protein